MQSVIFVILLVFYELMDGELCMTGARYDNTDISRQSVYCYHLNVKTRINIK